MSCGYPQFSSISNDGILHDKPAIFGGNPHDYAPPPSLILDVSGHTRSTSPEQSRTNSCLGSRQIPNWSSLGSWVLDVGPGVVQNIVMNVVFEYIDKYMMQMSSFVFCFGTTY